LPIPWIGSRDPPRVARVVVHPGGTHVVVGVDDILHRVIAGCARLDAQPADAAAAEQLCQLFVGAMHILFEVRRQPPVELRLAQAKHIHGI